MEQTVLFPPGNLPTFDAIRSLLAARGFPLQLRMIDGELAFPDEQPSESWRELRVSTPQGMITLRRDADRIAFVTWGNADRSLTQAWNALVWACAHAGSGQILTEHGPVSADDYRQIADLPEGLCGK
jgi:hypothetical protein